MGHQMSWKLCNFIRLVVKSDRMKGFFAPLKPKRDTAYYINIVSISIFITFSIYRYTVNVKAKHWRRCIPSRDKRCEKPFDIIVSYHPSHEFARFSGHLVTHRDDSLLVSQKLTKKTLEQWKILIGTC